VPRHLVEEHKHNRHRMCSILMEQCNHEGDNFLNHRDETRIHHYDPETQWHSMQWQHTPSPSCKKVKSQPSARKLLLTVFWDFQRPILKHYMESGTTVTSVNYCDMLRRELRSAIRTNRRGRLSQGVLLHQIACPHTAHLNNNTIQKLNWQVLEHPALSPDLTPSNFHLFGCLKNAVRGRQFVEDDEMKEEVHDCYVINQKTFFPVASRSLQAAGLSVSRKRRLH